MFSGIIEAVGTVVGLTSAPRQRASAAAAHRLDVDLMGLAEGLRIGASVAIDGVCLTLAELCGRVGAFDVVPETWQRTTLQRRRIGDQVNLERALRLGDRLDGHFVQGHVEGVGIVERVERSAGEWKLWVHAPAELLPAIVPKGSIALDGTSLTVVDVLESRFCVALVPITLERTVLGRRGPGDELNIETDILARLVLRRLESLSSAAAADGVLLEKLREGGFV